MNNIKPIIFGILGASLVTNVVLAVELHRQRKISAYVINRWLEPKSEEEEKEDE